MTERADPPNLDTIIKLLGMTGSSHDAEALSAIRLANKFLAQHNWTWDDLLRAKVTIKVFADPFSHVPTPPLHQSNGRTGTTPPPPRPAPQARPQPTYQPRSKPAPNRPASNFASSPVNPTPLTRAQRQAARRAPLDDFA